jgi:hypothetical protein
MRPGSSELPSARVAQHLELLSKVQKAWHDVLLKRNRDDGVSRLVVSLDSAKADTVLPEFDSWATLIRQLGG